MNSVKIGLISMIAAAVMSTSAQAGNLMAGSFAPNQDFTAEGSLRIFPSGSFFQSIFVPTAQTVMISFSAVCATIAPGVASTRVLLLVDDVPVYPTGSTANAFCATRGPLNAVNPETYSFVVAKALSAGSHDVQMHVIPSGVGATSRIRQLSLLAWN